jgi:transcriptional regulator with XRE-family HTH domain
MAMAQTETARTAGTFGELLREWRQRRRRSQLELAVEAGVSARHVSFLETGRARPSREMVVHLAEHLGVPLRERNTVLMAAGFAPAYPERSMDEPEMAQVRRAVDLVLKAQEPYPAVAVDRYWNVVLTNAATGLFLEGIGAELLGPPTNAYRVGLHPDGLARRVINFDEYAHHLVARLRHDVSVSFDPGLVALLEEVERYPNVAALATPPPSRGSVVLPIRLRHGSGELALFSTITTFGTPIDVTVAELAIESFFPADAHTAEVLRGAG